MARPALCFLLPSITAGRRNAETNEVPTELLPATTIYPLHVYRDNIPRLTRTSLRRQLEHVTCPLYGHSTPHRRSDGSVRNRIHRCGGILVPIQQIGDLSDPQCAEHDWEEGCRVTHTCPICSKSFCQEAVNECVRQDFKTLMQVIAYPHLERALRGAVVYPFAQRERLSHFIHQRFPEASAVMSTADVRYQDYVQFRAGLLWDLEEMQAFAENLPFR